MYLKQIIADIGQDIVYRAEDITAFSLCFLVVNSINWQSEIIRFSLGITASIISGYVVNRLKKHWDTPTKKRNGKKN